MKKKTHSCLAVLAMGMGLNACATTEAEIKPYPPAAEGQVRHVIQLPQQANEYDFKVELIAGKTMEVDCNHRSLGGEWQEKTVQGWGYTYYELEKVGPGISTMMACPPGSTRQAFVQVGGEPLLVRYNSKLPLVLYAPSDVEVRYRVWAAGLESVPAPRR
ncbi:serine protease inhibitor ecotin [Pseudothauera nasutitermitis]|uniref:Serine protease inhibitor ecotin n=1 Tax=Pseudothauera nasutitermitis TaxID=2565930 RepID=A0A4V3WC28_9RHOO|nr:serine protease inhibitor ecotin [Pseudothauera nasutitermitis]THF65555.1 serine protease inhibitor ecotin [Pseudothauera nasutitermitis]